MPGRVLYDDPYAGISIPFPGAVPPPGFTLIHDSITFVSFNPMTQCFHPTSSFPNYRK